MKNGALQQNNFFRADSAGWWPVAKPAAPAFMTAGKAVFSCPTLVRRWVIRLS
jgi:hypothetical protein